MRTFGFEGSLFDPAAHGFDRSHLYRPRNETGGVEVRVMYRRDDHVSPDAPPEYRNDDPDSRRLVEFLQELGVQPLTAEYIASCDRRWHDFLAWVHEHDSAYGALLVGDHPSVGRFVILVGSPGMGYPGDSELVWISPEGLENAARLAHAKLKEWGPSGPRTSGE